MTALRPVIHRRHAQFRPPQIGNNRCRRRFIADLRFLAVYARKFRGKRNLILLRLDADQPVRHRNESADFTLAFDQKTQCYGLHPSGGQEAPVGKVLPQHRRHLKAHKTVKNSSGLL